ncbi:sigma-70 family RNA polymerase sigma factor [Stackebrandtia nassauensis]|uniref:RNA polymerase, sigma-24 subunit, ECF subfamily n=1 Tax=Stackebrandtia nassauensis (strain DSM 44728 / CIP 108903 / NRRL B-16338 / NBRC 102104 / LLR-40K-21) TaxID=446470 RepID=D3Q186_STANL|nr:sigma-70 family RNA polymerase sigma factor [Stackebrandtia nassauensis]ADD45666.1 RNA polymerase, sigma-24 subunit, ECF subfamily [Stackebrandtia nassauensis DSM 44728]
MDEKKLLAERFEAHRDHLRAVAYRILGSLAEAEDAVQETWLKAERADTTQVENLGGWLTTVTGRVCLDMLRSKKSRREDSLDDKPTEPVVRVHRRTDPEEEALLADSVGLALLVVLDTLSPVERLAFVLHDMFAVPFADIAPIVERSPETTQRLASRARQRVRGKSVAEDADRSRRHKAVDAFLRAAREGEFEKLLAMLAPDVKFRADEAAARLGGTALLDGARSVAENFNGQAQLARTVLLDGEAGALVAPRGKLLLVLEVRFDGDLISEITAIADSDRLAQMEVSLP